MLGTVVLSTGSPIAPAGAAEGPDEVLVAITRLSPAVLVRPGDVTIGGVVRNPERHPWVNVKVYVAAPKQPLVARGQVRAALATANAETGPRVVDPRVVVPLGTLRAGQSRRFTMTVSSRELGLSGADGVYPLGIQVLAAQPGAPAATVVAGGAVTLLPFRATRTAKPAPTTVLWPFLRAGPSLAASIQPGGQLRNLLDLAATTPRRGSDVVIDPSLLSAVEAMARLPGKSAAAAAQRRYAGAFLADLTRLADRYSCATVGYDRPDDLAITSSPFARELDAVVGQATAGTLRARDLDCMQIAWPSAHGINRTVLTAMRRRGVEAVVVSPWALPAWDATRGNLVVRESPSGDLPLVVDDRLGDAAAGLPTPLTLRQLILGQAVLASIAASRDVAGTSTVVIVDPRFNPGRVGGEPLAAVYDSTVTEPKNFAASVQSDRPAYVGTIPDQATSRRISGRLVTVAADAAQTARLLDGILLDDADRTSHAQLVARLVSQRWRGHSGAGLDAADRTIDELSTELAAISVDGPEALTLSSGTGQFPVTVGNRTPHRVRVTLEIDSSAPGVRFRAPRSVEVSAGENRTVTVNVDMEAQTATTVSVRLSSAEGLPFGAATVFNIRSTRVGAALWIAIGLSVAFVAVALLRRFARPGHRPSHEPLPLDDFDD